LACRTNANHLARLAFGVIPCDKYNHCGGEGPFWITARTLSGWPPSPPTESQIHLEEKPHLLPPRIRNLILAGKPVTPLATQISVKIYLTIPTICGMIWIWNRNHKPFNKLR
jgi:hypothetical protein